jgi:acyl-CoA dehydrogenase
VHKWRVGRNVIKAYKQYGTTASAVGGDLIQLSFRGASFAQN